MDSLKNVSRSEPYVPDLDEQIDGSLSNMSFNRVSSQTVPTSER